MYDERMKYNRWVKAWIVTGLVMVLMQIVLGGITRLTESGLSITKWEPIGGIIPPLSDSDWNAKFELYKNTPQYREVFEGISMSDFKFIFFWEFIHRLWARFMGFVFLVPFIIFLYKKWIDPPLIKKLLWVILLSILAAVFGWIMVKSGLLDRPWVNAYKLSIHFLIAISVYTALYYCYAYVSGWFDNPKYKLQRRSILILLGLVFVQLFLGGIISGMKAAVIFPTWPLIGNEFFPHILFSSESWKVENFINYDQNVFMPSLIHFLHRMTAYIIFVYVIWFILKVYNKGNYPLKRDLSLLFFMLISQIFIGIIMLINSKGEVPVSLGVLHQLVAVLFLTSILTLLFKSRYQQKI